MRVMHDLDAPLDPMKSAYKSSDAFKYVSSEDVLKDTDFIDSPFYINNMAELREAGLMMAEKASLDTNESMGRELNKLNAILSTQIKIK